MHSYSVRWSCNIYQLPVPPFYQDKNKYHSFVMLTIPRVFIKGDVHINKTSQILKEEISQNDTKCNKMYRKMSNKGNRFIEIGEL